MEVSSTAVLPPTLIYAYIDMHTCMYMYMYIYVRRVGQQDTRRPSLVVAEEEIPGGMTSGRDPPQNSAFL